jgi:hypothetical protein
MMQFLQELSRRNNKRVKKESEITPTVKPADSAKRDQATIIVDQVLEIAALNRELAQVKGCLAGIRLALADAGGFESTIKQIDRVLYGT